MINYGVLEKICQCAHDKERRYQECVPKQGCCKDVAEASFSASVVAIVYVAEYCAPTTGTMKVAPTTPTFLLVT